MKHKYKTKSLKAFPFGDNPTPEEELFKVTLIEWYEAKHRVASKEEISFINNITINKCPYCNSTSFIKDGHRKEDNIQKYKCKLCNRGFTPLTNTIFDCHKIPISEWFEYLLHLFEFHSIKTSSYDNRNADSTGRYWLAKVFEVLKNVQDDVLLDGTIYLDETYFPKIKSDNIVIDGKKLRGISQNKIGVAVATNLKKSIFIVTNTSKPSDKSTLKAYEEHIKEGSTIIHDKEKSHNILIKKLNLSSTAYSSKELKAMSDKDNPLKPVNDLHKLAKRFMKEHGSYNRDDLQDWMNLLWFILNEPNDKYAKVLKFIELAINSPKRVKYRDVMMVNKPK